jgi:hypothetical protein
MAAPSSAAISADAAMQDCSTITPPARTARLAALVAGALVALAMAFAPSAHASAYQWTLDMPTTKPMTNYPFALYNEVQNDYVAYKDRGDWNCTGINLGWTNTKQNQWRFRRQSGATGVLVYGERLALLNTHPDAGYIHYEWRLCGINLKWTSGPDYEWVVRGGPAGTPVNYESDNALYNVTEKDDLVYAWRPGYVINLRWEDDAGAWYCQYYYEC